VDDVRGVANDIDDVAGRPATERLEDVQHPRCHDDPTLVALSSGAR
jgi:hypothetical protein